jgi:hypothetical protein
MGLDMYFYAEKIVDTTPLALQLVKPLSGHIRECWDSDDSSTYISGWEFSRDPMFEKAKELAGFGPSDGSPHITACPHAITVCAAYWRKANQIHAWFVDECGDGVDECQIIEVSPAQLGQLVLLCRKALRDKEPLIEPRSGFFFGGTEIDEYYWGDLEDTVKQLAPLAEFPGRMYYRASW